MSLITGAMAGMALAGIGHHFANGSGLFKGLSKTSAKF